MCAGWYGVGLEKYILNININTHYVIIYDSVLYIYLYNILYKLYTYHHQEK